MTRSFFDKNYEHVLKGMEKQLNKFFLFLYFFITNSLILSISIINDEENKTFLEFVSFLNEFPKVKFEQGNNFKKILNLTK